MRLADVTRPLAKRTSFHFLFPAAFWRSGRLLAPSSAVRGFLAARASLEHRTSRPPRSPTVPGHLRVLSTFNS